MRTCNRLLILVILAFFTALTAADETGIFFGGGGGYSALEGSDNDLVTELASIGITSTATVDDDDVGWKVFLGYNFTEHFGLEAAYVDLGDVDFDIAISAPIPATSTAKVEVDGFTIFGIARYPLSEQIELFAKVGGLLWDSDGEVAVITGAATSVVDIDDDGFDISFGLGMKYEFTEHFGIRAEWERYADVTADENDVDSFTASIEIEY
jgi:hypothetical protein